MAWVLDCLFASAFEPRPRRVNVLGGAPGQNPDGGAMMVSIHSLSELERLKLQETAYQELVARRFLSEFRPERALPVDRPNTLEKWIQLLRGQERGLSLKTFGVSLKEVLVNELTRRKHLELIAAMQVEEENRQISGHRRRRGNVVQRMFGSLRLFFSRRWARATLPQEFTRRGRRGAISVDSLAELEDGALLLQTLQLSKNSFPIGQRLLGSKRKMSLNPIAKQIPQIVEVCCSFIEKHGLRAVGIFTEEYSEERVQELREEFDQGLDVVLDDTQNVHDVAALLTEFFRDMKDSLIPDDLHMSFLMTATLKPQDQLSALQLLVYLMPPCHSDTLERLLKALHSVTEHCEDVIGMDGQLVFGNRMTSTNLALVFGSALLKKGRFGKRESRKTKLGINHYVASVNVVRAMIDNWDVLFQVPPHIQRQVAKRVWKSSPEAIDFIRRRKLRKIQSAQIKMEEDALLSDPVENSAEIRAAVLGQSTPFDEGQFPAGGQALGDGQSCGDGQALPEGQVFDEDEFFQDVPVNEEQEFEYLNLGVVFEEFQNLEISNDFEIQVPHLEGIPELDEDVDDDDDEILNFDDLPPLEDIMGPDAENPDFVETPSFEEVPYFHMVPDPEPEEIPELQEIPNPDEHQDQNLEEVPGFVNDQNLDIAEVPYLDVIQNGNESSDNEEHVDASDDEHLNYQEDPDLEEVPALDDVPNDEVLNDEIPNDEVPNDELLNDETSNAEEVPDHAAAPVVNDGSESEDIPGIPASGLDTPNHEEYPEINGLLYADEDPNFDEDPTPEISNDASENTNHEGMPIVNAVASSEEDSSPEVISALLVITNPEAILDFDDINYQEYSSEVSEVSSSEEVSDYEDTSTDEETSDASEVHSSEENPNHKEYSVSNVVSEPEDAEIHSEVLDPQKDQANVSEEDAGNNVTPESEDVSILNTIPDLQPYLAINLEEIMNMESVPVPDDVDPKEVQSPKSIQFYKEDTDVMFPVDTTLLKNKSQPGQVMDYKSFPESLKSGSCFLPFMTFCSSEEPAVPPGTAYSHDDEEGAGKPLILEQERPLLRMPPEKEAKTGIGSLFA